MDKHICPYCGKEFDKCVQLGGHVVWCRSNYNRNFDESRNKIVKSLNKRYQKNEYKLNCCVCGAEYKLLLTKHKFDTGKYRKTCSDECAKKLTQLNMDIKEKNKKVSETAKRKATLPDNLEDLSKYPYIIKTCPTCGKLFHSPRKYCSIACADIGRKKNLSISLKNNPNAGGLRPNAIKKHKSGWYHGIHCDSSWELAFVIYCEDHNIHPKRNTVYLEYIYNNKTYKYYPDFDINGVLYEIKGYESEQAKAKHEQHPEVVYINKDKIKKYLDYVISKYGKDFIKLYDKMDNIPK